MNVEAERFRAFMLGGGGGTVKKIVLWDTRLSKNVLMPWKDRMAGAVRAQAHITECGFLLGIRKRRRLFAAWLVISP